MRSQPIDCAASTRRFLIAATQPVVDGRLPQLTQVDAGLRAEVKRRNEAKPAEAPAAMVDRSPFVTTKRSVKSVDSVSGAVDTGLRPLTAVDARLPIARVGKTNPPTRPTTLTSRQLAAARLLACGRSPTDVAAELGISRQALWKWRRRADFDAEVFRLHECLTWTAGATMRAGPRR